MGVGHDRERSAETTRMAFREAVESTGHSIYWTDTTGTIEYVNPAFEEQTGYAAETAVGNNANILQSGVHDDWFYERLWDTILRGDVWEGEIINQRRDGTRYVAKQTISPITDEEGEIVRFVAINEDITDLREYQERLKRQRDRFSVLLDTVPVPLVLAEFENETPVVKQPNRLFKETFGFTGLELGGSSLDKFIVDDPTSPQTREVNDKLRRGEPVHREVRRKTADDDERVFLLNAAPLTGERDEALMTYIDITDRKRAEDELRQKTDELERFANVVSHDLRNPLNVAEGHLSMLTDDCESQHVEPIRNALTRMRELIENILMLARQGRAVDEMVPVSLATCTADSWETVDTATATVQTESSRTIRADPSRLRQLFGNLIRNAIEHAGEDVTITVGDLEDGFFVQDDGPGIPEADRADVFEAGYTSTKNGTGFGLSIVEEIVDAHGWTISVTDAPGGGARFEITGVETAI